MNITKTVKYVGVNDRDIDLFEGQYVVENGMAYNSYAIIDDKIAIVDSVEKNFGNEWLDNIENALEGREPDYLIVQHMEPDHSANITTFASKYPNAIIVSTAKSFAMMKNFFGSDFADRQIIVGENSELSLGGRVLKFITAPMVHWPEVIFTYDASEKILFSADAFGKFGALDTDEDWACEARRYYFGIVGKYGAQVQAVLKKVSALEVEKICPLHGPFLTENLGYYFNLYNTWSSYGVESEGVVIAYTSVYGHTKEAVELLACSLEAKGVKVALNDLARCDMAEAVEDAFRYGKIVLATTTYNADVFPFMREFITHLTERNFQNKTVAFIENGSWAPQSGKLIREKLSLLKDCEIVGETVTIRSSVKQTDVKNLENLAKAISLK